MSPSQPIEVLITTHVEQELVKSLTNLSPLLRITVIPAATEKDIPDDVWARSEILFTGFVLPEADKAPKISWIQFQFAGIDHVLDAPLINREGLKVTTMSGASASQMTEHLITMMLALGRSLPEHHRNQSRALWPPEHWKKFKPLEIRDSTVGIIGYGSIGRQTARLLHAFGATVLATKNNIFNTGDQGYTQEGLGDPQGDFVHRLYPAQALRSMVSVCDYVLITLPLTSKTKNLVNADILAAMKPTAYLVDVSRGGILDHKALLKALQEKKLAGAALDVFPQEPLPSSSPLWQMQNVIITPHVAGLSHHYTRRAMALFAENLQRFLTGQDLLNLYFPDSGY